MARPHIQRLPTYHREDAFDTGYVLPKCGVFATLDDTAITTCTEAGTWYPIEGTFTNDPMENFTVTAGPPPGIVVDGACPGNYKIDWHASIVKASGTSVVQMGIQKNGVILPRSVMETTVTTLVLQMSGVAAPDLEEGDVLSLVVKSSNATDPLTIKFYTTTIARFFASPK